MYSLEFVITIAAASATASFALTFWLVRRNAPSAQQQQALEEQITEFKQRQHDYQQQVSEHFNETGALLNQLTNSYRDVHSHLAKGAQLLAGDPLAAPLISLTETSDTDTNANNDANHTAEIPESDMPGPQDRPEQKQEPELDPAQHQASHDGRASSPSYNQPDDADALQAGDKIDRPH